jgi:hypothetical protein
MVYFVAVISVVLFVLITLAVARTPEHPVTRRNSAIRTAKILLPYFGVLAGVSTFYAVLSLPVTLTSFEDTRIAQLRALECEIPAYATAAKDWVPPWFAMALMALAMLVMLAIAPHPRPDWQTKGLSYSKKGIELMRKYAAASTFIASALTLACGFTVFGDGLSDQKADIESHIHAAQLRFTSAIDVKVREFGSQIVEETVKEMKNDDNPATRFLQIRDSYQAHLDSMASRYARGRQDEYWQNRSTMLSKIEPFTRIAWPPTRQEMDNPFRGLSTPAEPIRVSIDPSAFSYQEIDVMAFRSGDVHEKSSEERHELASELVAGATDALGKIVANEPWIEFCYGALSDAVKDAISRALNKSVIEKALRRFVERHGDASALNEEAKLIAKQVDVAAHWKRFNNGNDKNFAKLTRELEKARDILRPGDINAAGATTIRDDPPLAPEDRPRLIKLLKEADLADIAQSLEKIYAKAADTRSDPILKHDVSAAERDAFASLFSSLGRGPWSNVDYFKESYFESIRTSTRTNEARETIPSKYKKLGDPGTGVEAPHPRIGPRPLPKPYHPIGR